MSIKQTQGREGAAPRKQEVITKNTFRRKAAENSEVSQAYSFLPQTDRPMHELTGMEKIEVVRRGLTKQDLEQVKESFGLDYETLAKVLSVAKATLFNKKGTERFSSSLSEKIFALADLYSYGFSVFESKELFNAWMEQENRALGNIRPFELLDTMIGVAEVKNIIGRIEHGVYS